MKIQISVGIYGEPAKLNLTADLIHGKDEQYRAHIFRKTFSMDKGGKVTLPISFFSDFAKEYEVQSNS